MNHVVPTLILVWILMVFLNLLLPGRIMPWKFAFVPLHAAAIVLSWMSLWRLLLDTFTATSDAWDSWLLFRPRIFDNRFFAGKILSFDDLFVALHLFIVVVVVAAATCCQMIHRRHVSLAAV